MSDTADPRPEFVEHLEWQLVTALRRRERFARPVRAAGVPRVLGLVALVAVSLLCGAASAVAVERWQDGLRRELELTQARARVEVARFALELQAERAERVRALVERSFAPQAELDAAEGVRHGAETELALAELDLREVEVTGRPARDAVDAPLVAGDDLVTRRARLRLERARRELEVVASRLEERRLLHAEGFVPAAELHGLERAQAEAEARMRSLEHRADLRARFLAGVLSAAEARRLDRLHEARARVEAARGAYRSAEVRLEEARARAEAGREPPGPARGLELELLQLEAELRIGELEVRLLETSDGD